MNLQLSEDGQDVGLATESQILRPEETILLVSENVKISGQEVEKYFQE